jgi:uncharacterized protein YuzB (UPF0349 family)
MITLKTAEKLKEIELFVVPGWRFCAGCSSKAYSLVNSEVSNGN